MSRSSGFFCAARATPRRKIVVIAATVIRHSSTSHRFQHERGWLAPAWAEAFFERCAQEVVMKRGGVASSDMSFRGLSVRASQEGKRRGAGLRGKYGIGALLLGTALGMSQFVGSAHADEAQLQQQINAMQKQLAKMQAELAASKRQPAAVRGANVPAGAAPVTARNGNEIVIPAPSAPRPVSA